MKAVSVSQLNNYIKHMMDNDEALKQICVRGETSNYKIYPSGHHYFTLKDKEGVIKCVMFKSDAKRLTFRPSDGQTTLAFGRVSVFPRDGQYQLYCSALLLDGEGDLTAIFERLKEKLSMEGLFDKEHKKPLPRFPETVALVTSPAGAAVRDMIRIFRRRWPLCKLIIAPVRVQGEEAPGEIAAVIRYLNNNNIGDVIITGRGGGSLEDLWAFNDERVARAIFASHIPVVSAVGHEPDVTISDFVADVRASTPSHAAELTSPDSKEWLARINQLELRLQSLIKHKLKAHKEASAHFAGFLKNPMHIVEAKAQILDYYISRLGNVFDISIKNNRERFISLQSKLDALSPVKVLSRGYSIASKADGSIVKDSREVSKGELIYIRPGNGQIAARVELSKTQSAHRTSPPVP